MAWYVYGIVRDEASVSPSLAGLDGQPVELLAGDGAAAAVSPATAAVRGLEAADPEVVVEAVRTHDEVLAALSAARPVLPVRFGTVLADDDAVRELLDDRWGPLLDRVADADEWVLSVAAPEAVEAQAEADAGLSPGQAFFARRRAEATERQRARRQAVDVAETLHEQLVAVARDWRVLDLREPDVVARGAYLLPRDEVARVTAAVGAVEGASATLQGPLPPYRFTDR